MSASPAGSPSRIAILVHAVVPGDPRIRRQADALMAGGHEVDIFCLRDRGQREREAIDPCRIVRLPVRRRWHGFAGHMLEYALFTVLAGWRLALEHRSRRYHLVQVATLPDFLVFAALPLRLLGVPVVLDLHEDMPAFFADRFRSPLLRPLRPLIAAASRLSAALADELLTVHEPLRALSIARGIDPARITVVMNSPDPALFTAQPDRRPFMADGTLRLVHHSSLQRIYGLEVAIEALARARARPGTPPITLDVYGDGPHRSAVEAAIARTGTQEVVRLHGWMPIDRLPRLLAQADVGLVPSLPESYLAYSLSTKLLEYATLGIPAIASDLATFRAHFTDAALAFVRAGDADALADAIVAAAHHPAECTARAAEAQRQVAAYAWPQQARRYVGLVERLAARWGAG